MNTAYLLLLIPIVPCAIALLFNPNERGVIVASIIKTTIFAGLLFGITLFVDIKSDGSNLDLTRIVPAFAIIMGPPLGILTWWGRKRRERRLRAGK